MCIYIIIYILQLHIITYYRRHFSKSNFQVDMAMYSIGPTNCSCVVNKRLVFLVCEKRSISAGTHSYARQLFSLPVFCDVLAPSPASP